MKKKIIMAAPFDSNGRYAGGICYVANEIINATDSLSENEIELTKFETCRIVRQKAGFGEFNLNNIINSLRIYFAISSEVKDSGADILYYHSSVGFSLLKDVLAIRRAKKKTGIKTILHIHFAEYVKIMTGIKIIDHLLQRWMIKYIDHIVFLSQATMEEFVAHGGNKDKCSVVYNFCSFNISEERMREKFSKSREITKFLFVGSIEERKGIFDALECFKDIDEAFEFHVCGTATSELNETLFNEYREALGEKLTYHGYLSDKDKEDAYYNSDVLLLPSYGEGLPIVIFEAYNAGCAVIATNVGGIPEIVNDNNGTLINPGDKQQLRQVVLSYLKASDEMLKEKQMQNYKFGQNHTVENFIKSIADICDRII